MRIIFHSAFNEADYSQDAYDNAAEPGRMEAIMAALRGEARYDVDVPSPAARGDILRAHTEEYVAQVEQHPKLYAMASLAAGAANLAADRAMAGEPAFACVRPPGHHARRGAAWGHCTFNNVGIALLRLRELWRINSAFVLDFDQHTGDGTMDVLRDWKGAQVLNPYGNTAAEYLQVVEQRLAEAPPVDVIGVSAGFDAYLLDLGQKLATEDFATLGRLVKEFAIRQGHGRRFAVLEGGYYLPHLGRNVLAFCQGFG